MLTVGVCEVLPGVAQHVPASCGQCQDQTQVDLCHLGHRSGHRHYQQIIPQLHPRPQVSRSHPVITDRIDSSLNFAYFLKIYVNSDVKIHLNDIFEI